MVDRLFYTIREFGLTVCLIRMADGYFARGIAVCSKKDQFWKMRGRAIAEGRAGKVLIQAERSDIDWACRVMRPGISEILQEFGFGQDFKAKVDCIPANEIERKLLTAHKWE